MAFGSQSSATRDVPETPDAQPIHYLNITRGVLSWLATKDHKRIALLYLVPVTGMFFIGAFLMVLVRLELLTPEPDLMLADTYNRAFTGHGIIMVFFFLVPVVPVVLGNFCLPLMIGAKDLAFPRLNLASWYIYLAAAALVLYAVVAGGVDTGWTFYTPYSSKSSNDNVTLAVLAVVISGFGSILTSLNFIVTVHWLRAPGMTWSRLPIFVWTLYATSFIILLAVPVLTIALLLVGVERVLGIGIYDPQLGGDPLLFQHLFWFYSHPAVYVMILPGMGIVSEVVPCFARKQLFGYGYVAASSLGIAALGFLVWSHHMFVAGISVYAAMIFSFLSFFVAVPSAIKVFNWTATLYKGSIAFEPPMLYCLGFIALFTFGGMAGLLLATLGLDIHLHDTYFVVGHFHFIMVGGMVTAYMGGLHYWWPKMTGKMYPHMWANLAAVLTAGGFILTFLPHYMLGINGMPRRYQAYAADYQMWNVLSTAGASILGVGYVLPLFYFAYSYRHGKHVGPNPWRATGLEWQVPSPPPRENFAATPVVHQAPYQYHSEKAQNEP